MSLWKKNTIKSMIDKMNFAGYYLRIYSCVSSNKNAFNVIEECLPERSSDGETSIM